MHSNISTLKRDLMRKVIRGEKEKLENEKDMNKDWGDFWAGRSHRESFSRKIYRERHRQKETEREWVRNTNASTKIQKENENAHGAEEKWK